MTAAEERLFRRTQRYASSIAPDMSAAIMRAFFAIRYAMGEAQLTRAIETGFSDRIFAEVLRQAVLDVAFAPVRDVMRRGVQTGFRTTIADIPKPPRTAGAVSVGFNILHPNVLEAINALESRVMTDLAEGLRETIRQRVKAGLEAGLSPRAVAKGLRDVVGLPPAWEKWVRDYETKLREAHLPPSERTLGSALDNERRNKRYDAGIAKAEKTGIPLTEKEIILRRDAYSKQLVALNAETVSRTATLDALRLGQRLSWEDAIDKGIVGRGELMKQRIGVNDDRERPEHVAINDQIRQFDEPYSNGEIVSGDLSWNCRCLDKYFVQAA